MLGKEKEEMIQHAYDRQKYGRIKGVLILLLLYVLMIGIVSLFLGNPFPHRENVLFFSVWDYGWIHTDPYFIVLCGAVSLSLWLVWVCAVIQRDLTVIDKMFLQQCDAERYLEAAQYGVSYGKSLKLRGFQKTVFLMLQQRLAAALIANEQLEVCREFLSEKWTGKKNSRLYKQAVLNLDLVEAYHQQDVDKFSSLLQQAGAAFKKNKLFAAEQIFLEQKYGEAVEFLETYEGKNPYHEVLRQYLKGKCFDRLGKEQQAEVCMRYVSVHGNTLPCQKEAQEWLNSRNGSLFFTPRDGAQTR